MGAFRIQDNLNVAKIRLNCQGTMLNSVSLPIGAPGQTGL